MEFSHIPVLLEQAVDALAVKENGIYVDGTAGGGGHTCPMHMVATSQLMYCMVSYIAMPDVMTPPGELMYRKMSFLGFSDSKNRS